MRTRLHLTQLPPGHPDFGHERLPLDQGSRAAELVCLTVDEVALGVEVIKQRSVNRDEFLQRLHSPETQRRPLSSTKWQMRIFSPVVEMSTDLPTMLIAQLAHGSGIGSQSIRDDGLGFAVPLQHLFRNRKAADLSRFLVT